MPSFSAYPMSTPCQPSAAVQRKFKHKLFSSVRGTDGVLTFDSSIMKDETKFFTYASSPYSDLVPQVNNDLRHWLASALSTIAIERSHFSPLLPLIADAHSLQVGQTNQDYEKYSTDLDKIVESQAVTLFPSSWHHAASNEALDIVHGNIGGSAIQSRFAQLFFYAADIKAQKGIAKEKREDRLYRCQVSYINLMLNLAGDDLIRGLEYQTKEASEGLREICLASFAIRFWSHHPINVGSLIRLSTEIFKKILGITPITPEYFAIHPDLKNPLVSTQPSVTTNNHPRPKLKFIEGGAAAPTNHMVTTTHLNTTSLTDLFLI
ncbi:hypothetical protein [Vibrio phage vB_VhaS-a]|nr:hypothetical protein [Vibrio phage vB_VhaS-a]